MRIDIAGFTRGAKRLDHRAVLSFCERADDLGFDGIWFNEFHFQQPPDPYPSTLLLAAAILARTERLRVGTSIVVLPLYHPLLLAEQIAQLHGQSEGRFDFGIGRGTHPATFTALGLNPETTRIPFEQSFAIMSRAWVEPTCIGPDMAWPQTTHPVGPLLAGQEIPPVYVAGTTQETIDFAARNHLPLLLSLEPPETNQLALYGQALAQGHPSRIEESSLCRYVSIASTTRKAHEEAEALLSRLYRRRLRYAAERGQAPGEIAPPDMDGFLRRQMIAGDPESCLCQLRDLSAATGIKSIRLIFNANGEIDDRQAEAGLDLFAREVLPFLRPRPPATPNNEERKALWQ